MENVIFKHTAVAECAVIGMPDKLLGEDLCAFVKCNENTNVSEPRTERILYKFKVKQ